MAEATRTKQECIIRPARDIDEVRALWWPLMQELDWNRAEQDLKTHYLSANPNPGTSGWLVAASTESPDKAEGCVISFIFDNSTAWIGYFCMKKAFQGIGWGAALFRAALEECERAGAELVGLDAVPQQVKTYERRGFVGKGMVRLMVRDGIKEGEVGGEGGFGFEHVEVDGERLVPLEEVPSSVLVESDLSIGGMKRGTLWSKEAMFESRDDAWGLALVSHGASNKDALDGWILVRSCQHGFRFGPIYANSRKDAAFLLHQAMYRLQGKEGSYIAEVWQGNKAAVEVFEEAGWKWCEIDYHRMWLNGKVPREQQQSGRAEREMWAVFDAGEG